MGIYKKKWIADKSQIYYPVHLTPTYNSQYQASLTLSDNVYKAVHEETKHDNRFLANETELYNAGKAARDSLLPRKYRETYLASIGQFLPIEETPEMVISRLVRPLLSRKTYEEAARRKMSEYNIDASTQVVAQAIVAQQLTDKKLYTADFRNDIQGKGAADFENLSYPENARARKCSKILSQFMYTKEGAESRQKFTLPVDNPNMVRVKNATILASDIAYKKEGDDTAKQCKGYQTIDSRHHPIVLRAEQMKKLLSNRAYKKEWLQDKNYVYFPYQLTAEYEVQALTHLRNQEYKKDYDAQKATTEYDVTTTPSYQFQKKFESTAADRNYKKEYIDNKGPPIGVDITPEMVISKDMKQIISKQIYESKAKKIQTDVHVQKDGQEIAHAIVKQHLSSKNEYKSGYIDNQVGKPPTDVTISYPEHNLHKKMTLLANKPIYVRVAKKMLETNEIPVDTPEFILAKHAGLLRNEREYRRRHLESLPQYRGYQTLEAKKHPEVVQAQKANALQSKKAYVDDWENDKAHIYFPYNLTSDYDAKSKIKQLVGNYDKAYEGEKSKTHFNATETPQYETRQEFEKKMSEQNYKGEYNKTKGQKISVETTPDMVISRLLQPFWSKTAYEDQARKNAMHNNLGSDGQEISHAIVKQHLSSKNEYKSGYIDNQVGKPPTDVAISYPEHNLHKKMSSLASNLPYIKEARKNMEDVTLPLDTPTFEQARKAMKLASELEYQKKGREINEGYKGFQKLTPDVHPIVKQAKKMANLASQKHYQKDWENEKTSVYYSVHLTPGFEAVSKIVEITADSNYTKEGQLVKERNHFVYTDTDKYRGDRDLEQKVNDRKYVEEYERNKSDWCPVEQTMEMVISNLIAPLLSNKAYSADAQRVMQQYNLDAGTVGILQSLKSQILYQKNPYTEVYRNEIRGKAPHNVAISYPETQRSTKNQKLASKTAYEKKMRKEIHDYTMPLDTPLMNQVKKSTELASNLNYQKEGKKLSRIVTGTRLWKQS